MAKSRKPKQKAAKEDGVSETLARKIWLAGIGAYGKSIADAQEQFGRAGEHTSRRFNELVETGQEIEQQTRAQIEATRERLSRGAKGRIDEARDKLADTRDRISDVAESNTRSVEELIGRVRERMGFDGAMIDRLDHLADRVENLTDVVTRLVGGKISGSDMPKAGSAAAAKPKAKAKAKAKGKAKAKARSKATADAVRK